MAGEKSHQYMARGNPGKGLIGEGGNPGSASKPKQRTTTFNTQLEFPQMNGAAKTLKTVAGPVTGGRGFLASRRGVGRRSTGEGGKTSEGAL